MDPVLNPYTPGSGLRPAELVGRDREIDTFDRTIARMKLRYPERGMILTGLRGVGKTVLMRRLHDHAANHGWMTVFVEGQSGQSGATLARKQLSNAINIAARQYSHRAKRRTFLKRIRRTVDTFDLAVGLTGVTASVTVDAERAGSGQLELDIPELIEDISTELATNGSVLAIFIDEMQELDADLLAALVTTQHQAGQQNWPFLVFGAGLPNLPAVLSELRTYAERLFDYRLIGPIDDDAATAALSIPAQRTGATYEPEALSILVHEAAGYPYFLQQFGRATWDVAPGDRIITKDDAMEGVRIGYADLDAGFFPARWTRATVAERRYLSAMAKEPGPEISTGHLVRVLGEANPSTLSPVRRDLILKGLIYPPRYGYVAFTVPGMSDYITRAELADGIH